MGLHSLKVTQLLQAQMQAGNRAAHPVCSLPAQFNKWLLRVAGRRLIACTHTSRGATSTLV